MKTFVLFQHSVDNKPIVESSSLEVTYRSNMYLMDKWAQEYDILYGYDKVLNEEFYVVNINGEQFHAESLDQLFHDMREYHNINIVAPFLY